MAEYADREHYIPLRKNDLIDLVCSDEIFAAASAESGVWGINMDVDMEVFERIQVFTRGDGHTAFTRRPWWKLWRKEELVVPTYGRLVLFFKLRKHRRLDSEIDVDDV